MPRIADGVVAALGTNTKEDVVGRVAPRIGMCALALAILGFAGTAQAADPQVTIGADGKTAPVFDYTQAVRERVFIPQPGIDQDANGRMDFVTADIIRPKEAGPDVQVPAIIDPSPYYTTLCRGNEAQCMADWDGDGVNDRWPLFYDNYFVPRGYAYVLAPDERHGLHDRGLPDHGGAGRHRGREVGRRLAQRPRGRATRRRTPPRSPWSPTGTTAARR